jgi:outer membrane protein assembly factor BamB
MAGRAIWRRPALIAFAAGIAFIALLISIGISVSWPGTPAGQAASARWTYNTGQNARLLSAVAGGTVFVGSAAYGVYAVDAATGHLRWAYATAGGVDSSLAVAGGTVYAGGEEGRV